MLIRAFFLFILTLISVQTHAAQYKTHISPYNFDVALYKTNLLHYNRLGNSSQVQVRGILDTIVYVKDLVFRRIDEANSTVARYFLTVANFSQTYLDKIAKHLVTENGTLVDNINYLIEQARNVSHDTACARNASQEIKELVSFLKGKKQECFDDVIAEMKEIVSDVMNKYNEIKGKMSVLAQRWTDCSSSLWCRTVESYNIGKEAIKIPAEVTRKVKLVARFVEDLKTKLKDCGTSLVERLGEEGDALVEWVDACLGDDIDLPPESDEIYTKMDELREYFYKLRNTNFEIDFEE